MTKALILSIAAGTMLLSVTPAAAQQPRPRAATGNTATTSQSAEAPSPNRRICVYQESTGSRLRHKVCQTAQQWERDGGIPAEADQ